MESARASLPGWIASVSGHCSVQQLGALPDEQLTCLLSSVALHRLQSSRHPLYLGACTTPWNCYQSCLQRKGKPPLLRLIIAKSAHMINVWSIVPGVDGISHGSVGEPEFVRHGLRFEHSDRLPLTAPPPAKAASVNTACCGSPVT